MIYANWTLMLIEEVNDAYFQDCRCCGVRCYARTDNVYILKLDNRYASGYRPIRCRNCLSLTTDAWMDYFHPVIIEELE